MWQGEAVTPIIQLQQLSKSFGRHTVLHGIDLEVPAGQVLGYIGPNGAGKSTTVKILAGMLDNFSGQATVCGFDVKKDPIEVKRRIGYIPESAALYDQLTPRQYLRFIGQLHDLDDDHVDRRVEDLLDVLDLSAQIDDPMSTYSKGMRQKVLIVSGLLHDPEVIFMDEPLSGLDANSVVIVKQVVARLAEHGKTVFYCSHVMDVVERVCDRIVIIDQGRIIADGSFEELQRAPGGTLEGLFTQLTSAGGHDAVAKRFVELVTESAEPHGRGHLP